MNILSKWPNNINKFIISTSFNYSIFILLKINFKYLMRRYF